ncbi:MAG: SUMF1/EgtB/PvdO family nonheme iron enzyme [Alphaproteobacteria bacterium]
MHGNISEWCADCWHETYSNAPADGSASQDANRSDHPRSVLRGGSCSRLTRWPPPRPSPAQGSRPIRSRKAWANRS